MENLFYGSHDFNVKEFANRRVIDEIDMIMTAFDCVLSDDSAIYCSSELTTGKRFYKLLKEHEAKSGDELKIRLGAHQYKQKMKALMQENVGRGNQFTENIRQRGEINLINPGPFKAQDFDQQHYLYLWELVIIRKVYKAQFNEHWEYSNGCALEYAIATRKGIPRLDHLGNALDMSTATGKLEHAIATLKRDSFKVDALEQTLERLRAITAGDDTSMPIAFQNDVARTG
jgi:hypothetical protein